MGLPNGKLLKCVGLVWDPVGRGSAAHTFLPSKQIARLPHTTEGVDTQKVAKELAGTIPFQTISYEGGGTAAERLRRRPRLWNSTISREDISARILAGA